MVFYVIFKFFYGGMAKCDPKKYPLNEKTRLAKGDSVRIGIFFMLFGILLIIGGFFLNWYEGDYGAEYYMTMYGSGVMSDFKLMISIAKIGGLILTLGGTILYIVGKKKDPII